jgi:hypothetical protein
LRLSAGRSGAALAIDGDHIGRRAGQRCHPGNEAALKGLGIERRKDIAKVIVRGRSVTERPKPTQKINLLLAEPRNIHERLRSAQNREQTQQQYLVQRIGDFATLARVR